MFRLEFTQEDQILDHLLVADDLDLDTLDYYLEAAGGWKRSAPKMGFPAWERENFHCVLYPMKKLESALRFLRDPSQQNI